MTWEYEVVYADIIRPHYWVRYLKFINSRAGARETNRTEMHHKWPKSFGGSDEPSNLVHLRLREHMIAHWLLHKALGGKMTIAFKFMIESRGRNLKSGRLYESVRMSYKDSFTGVNSFNYGKLGEESHFFGKKHTEETKAQMSISRSGSNNPNFGIQPWDNPKCNESHIDIWALAQTLYRAWLESGMSGPRTICKVSSVAYCSTIQTMYYKFREGWVPEEDLLWSSWMHSRLNMKQTL